MRVRSCVGALVAALACGLLSVSSAGAKTVTVGQLFTPETSCFGLFTALQTGVASGNSYVVPKAGVITSWSFHDGVTPVSALKLKVGRSVGGGRYKLVAQAKAGPQTANAVHTYKAHIAVVAGDLIGYSNTGGTCGTHTGNSLDTYAFAPGRDVAPGTTRHFKSGTNFKIPVSVRVSEDCTVPNLRGKTLKAAKKALKANSCTLGKVTPKGQTTGKVKSQSPAAGKTLKPGAKVNVRLG
jgi:hypothetical protein